MINAIHLPMPEQIVYIGQLMFERRLTDIAGGNISSRDNGIIYITPRYAGSHWHWRLSPENIITGPIDTDEMLEDPSFSREGLSHLSVYRLFPEVNAIIHAHPFYILPFCSFEIPIEPVLRATMQFGALTYIDQTPEYSQEQADSIIAHLKSKRQQMQDYAAAVLMPQHGIFVAGKDLWSAVDTLDSINTNAWCIIDGKILSGQMISKNEI